MAKYSKEDIIRLVKEQDIEFIRMQFTDIFGQLKNVAITKSQIEKAGVRNTARLPALSAMCTTRTAPPSSAIRAACCSVC